MNFQKSAILPRIGRIEQLASIRRYALEDGKGRGMRAFEVSNASGFSYTVYPDRGLDIGPALYNGLPLTWMTRNGACSPAFYDNTSIEWLRTWMGGLVTTCGWLNVGNPCTTAEGTHGIHGRMNHTPTEDVNARAFWNENGDYLLEITGRIIHSRVFGENLVTSRTIMTRLGWPGVNLVDRTENVGTTTMPLMQLYHMNFGWPLVSETMRIIAPKHNISARDASATHGLAEWNTMPPPTTNFAEQVIYHDLPADNQGYSSIRIENPAFGPSVTLRFRKAELPHLVQWRQAGVGDYVMGLEPANCYPEGQLAVAQKGLLRHIEPGETVETHLEVQVSPQGNTSDI